MKLYVSLVLTGALTGLAFQTLLSPAVQANQNRGIQALKELCSPSSDDPFVDHPVIQAPDNLWLNCRIEQVSWALQPSIQNPSSLSATLSKSTRIDSNFEYEQQGQGVFYVSGDSETKDEGQLVGCGNYAQIHKKISFSHKISCEDILKTKQSETAICEYLYKTTEHHEALTAVSKTGLVINPCEASSQ
jgi:hypothetical protein